MSKRYCIAFFVLCATLVACTTDVVSPRPEPPCLVNAQYVTADCQKQLDALAIQWQEYDNRLARRRTFNGILASLSIGVVLLGLGFAAVELKARYQNRVGTLALQRQEQKNQRQYDLAVLGLAGQNAIGLAEASRPLPQPVPHSLTITHNPNYSQSNTFTDARKFSRRHLGQQEEQKQRVQLHQDNDNESKTVVALPSAESALRDPEILAGYTPQGERVVISPKIIMAGGGIGGGMGSGKSSLVVWFAAQVCLKYNARLIVIDPHKGIGDTGQCLSDRIAPLGPYLECAPIGYHDMHDGLALVNAKLQERLIPAKDGSRKQHAPLLLLVDEFVSLLQSEYAEQMRVLGQTTSQQTRKVNVGAIYASHIWKKGVVGDMGYTIPTHGICRTSQSMACLQSGASRRQLPQYVETLLPGQFLWRDFLGLEFKQLAIPELPAQLIQSMAEQYTQSHMQQSDGRMQEVPEENDGSALAIHQTPHPKDARIIELIREGKSNRAIAIEVFNISGGRKYSSVTAHIERLREVA